MDIIRSYFIVLSLISIIYFLGLTELCHFPFKIQILHESILQWSCGDCCRIKKIGSKLSTIIRFGVYGTVDKPFDWGSCINSFTETGKRPQPTRLQGTSTRSDRGPLDPGDLKTFTIAAITLKEHDLIDKKQKSRKRGKFSAISLGSNRDGTSRGCWKWNFLGFSSKSSIQIT